MKKKNSGPVYYSMRDLEDLDDYYSLNAKTDLGARREARKLAKK